MHTHKTHTHMHPHICIHRQTYTQTPTYTQIYIHKVSERQSNLADWEKIMKRFEILINQLRLVLTEPLSYFYDRSTFRQVPDCIQKTSIQIIRPDI